MHSLLATHCQRRAFFSEASLGLIRFQRHTRLQINSTGVSSALQAVMQLLVLQSGMHARWWQYRVVSCCGMHGGGNIVLCLVVECTVVATSCCVLLWNARGWQYRVVAIQPNIRRQIRQALDSFEPISSSWIQTSNILAIMRRIQPIIPFVRANNIAKSHTIANKLQLNNNRSRHICKYCNANSIQLFDTFHIYI